MIFDFFSKKKKGLDPEDEREQMDMAYRLTFGSETGRMVLADIMKAGHLYEPSYTAGDAMETSFREGERNMLLYILSRTQMPGEREKLTEEVLEYGG